MISLKRVRVIGLLDKACLDRAGLCLGRRYMDKSVVKENIPAGKEAYDMTSVQRMQPFLCGVYKSGICEVVETERFSLVCYCSRNDTVLGTRLYVGTDGHKKLYAICEYDKTNKTIEYAYKTDPECQRIYANNDGLKEKLGQTYDGQVTIAMRRTETFMVNHHKASLPTVREAGIKNCLLAWRMADSFIATADRFSFWLCTGKTEYAFSIEPQDTNIYCGISYNFPFDFGLLGGRQFFRIRNYQDNSKPWCGFFSELGYECGDNVAVPIQKCESGKCVNTDQGIVWGLKRYTDDQIVLQGCGEDEYIFSREDTRAEFFCTERQS